MLLIHDVKRRLRAYGMREAYTPGGVNILYCGEIAIRLINDYTVETWNSSEATSGTIHHFDSIFFKNNAILEMGLEGLGVI